MDVRRRFLNGLATAAGFDPSLLDRSGTVVRAREERAGTGSVIVYQAGAHILIWCDPLLLERLQEFADAERTVDAAAMASRLAGLGSDLAGSADMRVLTASPRPIAPVPAEYQHRWLRADRPSDVALVRALTERSSPDDVDEAGLEDLDDFNERAINILVPIDQPDEIVAYASAADWDWDPTFGDIGVLVDAAHRQRGLGTLVVGHTIAALQADGRLPLYRHDGDNTGSQRIADAIGFEEATTLTHFAPTE